MQVTVASEILDVVRNTYLNDPSKVTFTDTVLLPLLKTAYGYLQTTLESNGVQCKNEEYTRAMPAGVSELYPLPVDLVIPRVMYERQLGSSDEFRAITYRDNIPQITPGPMLEYWSYRLDRIFFLGATTDREIKLEYQKSFPAVNTVSAVLFGNAEQYLAAKVAALAFIFITQSSTLASAANEIAEKNLDEIVNIQVKVQQAQVTRRKGYLPFRSH